MKKALLLLLILAFQPNMQAQSFADIFDSDYPTKTKIKYTYAALLENGGAPFYLDWNFSKRMAKVEDISYILPLIQGKLRSISADKITSPKLSLLEAHIRLIRLQTQIQLLHAPSSQTLNNIHQESFTLIQSKLKEDIQWLDSNPSLEEIQDKTAQYLSRAVFWEMELNQQDKNLSPGFGIIAGIGLGNPSFLSTVSELKDFSPSLSLQAAVLVDKWELGAQAHLISSKNKQAYHGIFDWPEDSPLLNVHFLIHGGKCFYQSNKFSLSWLAGIDVGVLAYAQKNESDKNITQGVFSISPALGCQINCPIFRRLFLLPNIKGKEIYRSLHLRGQLYTSLENYPKMPKRLLLNFGISIHFKNREVYRK